MWTFFLSKNVFFVFYFVFVYSNLFIIFWNIILFFTFYMLWIHRTLYIVYFYFLLIYLSGKLNKMILWCLLIFQMQKSKYKCLLIFVIVHFTKGCHFKHLFDTFTTVRSNFFNYFSSRTNTMSQVIATLTCYILTTAVLLL